MSILKDMYRNRLIPFEYDVPQTEEYKQARNAAIAAADELDAALSEEEIALFEKFQYASAVVEDLEQEDLFCRGIILGARLMREVMG